jgi:hypothetical protein
MMVAIGYGLYVWFFVFVFLCVWRDHKKIRSDLKKVNASWSLQTA